MNYYAGLVVAFNNLELTKKAVESLQRQDIGPMNIYFFDNGSSDGTFQWAKDQNFRWFESVADNQSPVKVFNRIAHLLFHGPDDNYDHFLAIANDVVLPPNAYRLMNQWRRGVVTASQTPDPNFPIMETTNAVSENTPMAAVLWRKWVYDAVVSRDGFFFDESFQNYCSDCDLALRIAACGIRGVQLDFPYWHFGSATLNLASPEEHQRMCREADSDRAHFVEKWKFPVTDYEYGRCAVDLNFKGGE